jgi:hypothetical protein
MEQAVRLLSFRMRSFRIMGNGPFLKYDYLQGVGVYRLNDERFPL